MIRYQLPRSLSFFIGIITVGVAGAGTPREAAAQRLYSGSTVSESQYSGASGLDANGRAVNADGRAIDRFGHVVDDYGRQSGTYRAPSHTAAGSYYPGGYSGLGYSNGIGYSVGLGGYSGGYYSSGNQFGGGAGVSATYVAPPRTIVVGGVYPSRTVMNNATRGGIVEYTNNGNGYIYSPGTSSQTVVSSGPSIFPYISVVQPTQPPVVIQTRPLATVSKTFAGSTSSRSTTVIAPANEGEIRLICPKETTAPLTYVLNGTVYTIKPGYAQTFADDRVWTIEFLRGGSGTQPIRYDLKAGTYQFSGDENGWDLKQFPVAVADQLPPAPAVSVPVPAPTPSPDL